MLCFDLAETPGGFAVNLFVDFFLEETVKVKRCSELSTPVGRGICRDYLIGYLTSWEARGPGRFEPLFEVA